jgi:Zn-dependent protease
MDTVIFAQQTGLSVETLINIAQFGVIFLFSLSFHEAAHAFMAYKCGDDTARLMGRMTLNPIPHIDPIGTLLMPALMLVSALTGANLRFLIGWAKPVPVNPLRFRNYQKGELLVSFAGPFSNLILLMAGALICRAILLISGAKALDNNPVFLFFLKLVSLNIVLFAFNLIPIHPLDGSHILRLFLTPKAAEAYERVIAPYGFLILIGLMYMRVFDYIFSFVWIPVEFLIFAGTIK